VQRALIERADHRAVMFGAATAGPARDGPRRGHDYGTFALEQ
jgi:hypothetical protein